MVQRYINSKQKLRMAIACFILLDGKDTRINHMLELFNNLNEIHKTYLLVPKPKETKVTSLNIKYVLWLDIPIVGFLLYQLTSFFELLILCKEEKINIIYTRHETFNFAPLIISKLLNIPYVVEVNGLVLEERRLSGASKQLIVFSKFSEKINYKHATRIISVTKDIKNCIVERYNIPDEQIVVIENGANIDLFKPMEQNKLSLGLDENYNYVGYVGSFARWHGLENLIKSAPLVLEVLKNTKFIFVGDGQLKSEMFNLIDTLNLKDNFIFVGRVPHNKVPEYINIFDVCMILKDKNISGSPLKLWEYMACGKPVIATNTSDFKVLKEFDAGILVDSEKYENTADAIITLLENNKLRNKMGLNGRKYVIENRSWQYVALNVNKVCQEAVREKR